MSGYEILYFGSSGNTVIGTSQTDGFSDFGGGNYQMGAGNDYISVLNSNFFATASQYLMEDGNDTVTFQYGNQIGTNAQVDGGAGFDTVTFKSVSTTENMGGQTFAVGGALVELINVEFVNIIGDAGNNTLAGTWLDDLIRGGAGDDTIDLGAGGSDHFVFYMGDGSDVITNINTATGADHDVIALQCVTDAAGVAINTFATLMSHLTVVAGDAVFDFGNANQILLQSADVASLSADDFQFS